MPQLNRPQLFPLFFSVFFFLGLCSNGFTQGRPPYVNKWKEVAMQNMVDHGVPSSITLAQGILESGNGNSDLTKRANNHFGIKCHKWNGPRVYHDDDEKGECFRKYSNGDQSYEDHSVFLTSQPRYNFLFDLKKDDYKGWAKGLKKAGYATNPKYPKLLITIIEEEGLDNFDKMVLKGDFKGRTKGPKEEEPTIKEGPHFEETGEDLVFVLQRQIKRHPNRIKYIEAKEADDVETLARELGLGPWQITRYNDISKDYAFSAGEIVFIQPKRRKGKEKVHVVKSGENLRDISQIYGVKIKRLLKFNEKESESWQPAVGEEIKLRR
ncbi:MAG: LysM repeat protein [Luteibaculaceae bacterium]|jgi:LysM repeat protein